jgi:hypothetical protein
LESHAPPGTVKEKFTGRRWQLLSFGTVGAGILVLERGESLG